MVSDGAAASNLCEVPPLLPALPLNAPLDKWQMIHRFDTVTECKENLLWYQKQERRRKLLKRPRVPYVATYGRCIASDDPHLKPKQDTPSSNLGPAPTH